MSVSRLKSGRWRAQVYDGSVGRNVSVRRVIPGDPASYRTKTEAKDARSRARAALRDRDEHGVTVGEWWTQWTTDPLFARPKKSTMESNAEKTRAFARAHWDLPIRQVTDLVAARWLAGGKRNAQVAELRVMFNDAASAKAGRLLRKADNPFAGLGISKGAGRANQTPPNEEMIRTIISSAEAVTSPDFAAWLQFAAYTGLRPAEVDAVETTSIDYAGRRVRVLEQYNSKVKQFTLPKNGLTREAPLPSIASEALLRLPLDSRVALEIPAQRHERAVLLARGEVDASTVTHRFCFLNLRDGHWTASGRAYHWKATRAAAGWSQSLYLATRHFAGWYMVNVLEMSSEDTAIALGHTDGGDLVRKLYGHRDKQRALTRVVEAYERVGRVVPMRRSA